MFFRRDAKLHGRRNPFVAQEGIPLLLLAFIAAIILIGYYDPLLALIPVTLFVFLFMVFRDPLRPIPSVALGVVSPVDGKVIRITSLDSGELGRPVHSVLLRVNTLGTYTARSPVEGKIMDHGKGALWVQTDEGEDIVLRFRGYRLGLAPHALAQFGERLGQGQRCAYLRLTRLAEIQLPIDGKVLVEPGQTVIGGTDILGSLRAPR